MNQELERFEPADEGGRISYEHLHRYAICRERVAGLRVLDVACGAGYGTNLLAQTAAEITGLDIDAGAIRRAKKDYRAENLSFVAADCYDMPFEAQSFDIIVANEMIEHISDHDAFIREAKRVLIPGGMLLVSTPNKPVYNRYKGPNPFHVSEMDIPEFRRLLKRHFKHVQFTGLRMALVSAGFGINGAKHPSNLTAATTYRGLGARKDTPEVANEELSFEDPEYVIATCSDRVIEAVASSSSIFFSNEDDLWLEHEKTMAWASQLHNEDEALRADLQNSRSELDGAKAALDDERRTKSESLAEARQHFAMSSRLLSRLIGKPVEADSISMVDAMFSLNEQIVTQRTRLDMLAEVEQKAARLERDLAAARAAHEQLVIELESSRSLQELMTKEAHQNKVRMEELRRHSRAQHDERDARFREAEQRAVVLERELKEVKAALGALRLGDGDSQSDTAVEDRANISEDIIPVQEGSRLRRQSRLTGAYSEIHDQLGRASAAMRGAFPPPRAHRRGILYRLVGSRKMMRSIPFDRDWIERQDPDLATMSVAGFLKDPRSHRVDPHPLFSSSYYLSQNSDVAEAGVSPFVHYLDHGWREGRNPHPYFANDWYLQHNPDVAQARANPLVHYLEHGWREGRWPNPAFDPTSYLARHKDIEAAGIEPLSHFVARGREEQREVPFMGLERDWRSLVASQESDTLLDLLLSDGLALSTNMQPIATSDAWPPSSEFWIPQALRNFMIERGLERSIPLYTYYYSVMDAYGEAPDQFPSSDACRQILDRAETLSSELSAQVQGEPEASIIIPVYNNFLDTLLCVSSLLETKPNIRFEIILADDCSTDSTAVLIPKIGGLVRHIRQTENLGFVGNCNAAAEHARGRTIVLLNNDTLVFPGWLENIVAPFDQFDRIGLVGSKLINWDGRLQEAGGIFWKDGSAWNFGRGQNAFDPEFNYLKDVDYCSGASIAVAADLWRQLGGFDNIYRPAYCEDSDLAFRIRDAGYRTVFSPHSELIHHEGRSHGRDVESGIKAYQVANEKRLFERWRETIKRDHFPNGQNVLRARDRSASKPHILIIDHYVPQFDKDAGSRTMFHFIEGLIDLGWAITFWPENLNHDLDYTKALQNLGVEVIYGLRFAGKFSDFLRSRVGLYDAVLLSRPHIAVHFIDDLKTLTNARILYYGHDIHFERMKGQLEVANSTMDEATVEAMRALELGLCDRCDVILYPSEDEARLMATLVAPDVKSLAIPAYCFSDEEIAAAAQNIQRLKMPDEQSSQLLFVGGFSHGPNVDGIAWFGREVAPILRREGVNFELKIAGSNPTVEVWDLESDDTQVLGFVSDQQLLELYRNASVVIAPLRFGAGVKGKVVEAMARGIPVVTTGVGAQGLAEAKEYLFLGDTAEEFAAAVRLAFDINKRVHRAENALEYIRGHYSRARMTRVFDLALPARSAVSKAA